MKHMAMELEEEEEESESETEEAKDEVDDIQFDEFEQLKAKVKAKMPKKIAAKGITSTLRPIEEDSMEQTITEQTPEKGHVGNDEEFKGLTDSQKRKRVEAMMKNPSMQEVIEKQQKEQESLTSSQTSEIQSRLGKVI